MYTYAFLLNGDRPLELPEGIWGPLELVSLAELAALVEPDLAFETLQQSDRQLMQAVLSHDRVIQEVFQQTAVLPLRFGTCFISRQGLLDHLRAHQQTYLDKLRQLQDKAEYTLKAVPLSLPEQPIASSISGKDYFLAKRQLYQDQAQWQQQQQQELESLNRLIRDRYPGAVRGNQTNDGIERFYVLRSRQAESDLQADLSLWQTQLLHWELSLGEPLPPYHFV
ncbi:gas vesicle protein [Leptolyngbya sp. NK1-12]|uniref:Gas vesicle protein n=1 Tax=Leptolyngbya sp. NK1-12 TaxID=2547451 RepID=A0AA97AHM5_9CYAN|nr:gas vesicle protein [Leptolyngbya sp. NK1-12]